VDQASRIPSRTTAALLGRSQTRTAGMTRVVGTVFCTAAIVIALINNDTYTWAIGVPIVLAVVGVGLRIEAVLSSRSG
jgi:hypothetical protein